MRRAMQEQRDYLQALFTREIPLSTYMSVRVERIGLADLEVHAARAQREHPWHRLRRQPLLIVRIGAWGLLHVALKVRDLAPQIVLADSRIVFAAPIVDDLHARSRFMAPADLERFVDEFTNTGNAKIQIPATVSGADAVPAAHFTGTYAVAAR